jgi:2,3-bisphosphoglycerate-independent phosphoglycerate mutase
MKFLMVVLDGAGDRGPETPLEVASKPNIDSLAAAGKNGFLDLGYAKDVDSDVGYLTLLSCYSKKEYPGRGYIEALGVGLYPGKDDLCIRANFATLDRAGNVTDRRAGRDETGLDRLADALDGMEIDGVSFSVRRSTSYRLVILASGKGLSDRLRPGDPKRTGVPMPQVSPKAAAAKKTASALNKFSYRARKVLSTHPANKGRPVPANALILRSFGMRKDVESFRERFGLSASIIAGVNVAKGVGRFLGMDVPDVKGATGKPDTDLKAKRKAAMKKHGFVFLHINGTDIYSHDRDREGKARFIERIDKELGKLLEGLHLEDSCIVVTCDHRTVSLPRDVWKEYEHTRDPVPILISGDGIKPDEVKSFSEDSAKLGSLKLSGTELVPLLLMLTKKHQGFKD